MSEPGLHQFDRSMFTFLEELQANNDRDWFKANKDRYHRDVVVPALAFIDEMQPRLLGIAPSFLAVGKKSGGSLMRIYRDTRENARRHGRAESIETTVEPGVHGGVRAIVGRRLTKPTRTESINGGALIQLA